MGLFGKMKAAVGMGGAKIKIVLDDEETTFHQGDVIVGRLKLTGGDVEQTINLLKIQLKSKWTEPGEVEEVVYADGGVEVYEEADSRHTEVLDEIIMDEPFKVNNGFHETYNFDFEIPYEADITIEGEMEYFLYAQAEIPGAIDSRDRVNLVIDPSYEIVSVLSVLEDTFQFEVEDLYSEEGWIMAELITPMSYKMNQASEVLGLAMKNEEDGLRIELFLDLDGNNLRDFIESSTGREVSKYKIVMPYEQIVPDNEDADVAKIEEVFNKIFTDLNWT